MVDELRKVFIIMLAGLASTAVLAGPISTKQQRQLDLDEAASCVAVDQIMNSKLKSSAKYQVVAPPNTGFVEKFWLKRTEKLRQQLGLNQEQITDMFTQRQKQIDDGIKSKTFGMDQVMDKHRDCLLSMDAVNNGYRW